MSWGQAFLLGMIQGLTEFLPISSSAHLVLLPWFFSWEDPGLAFDVFLHFGTLLAMTVYFFHDLVAILGAGLRSLRERKIGFERERLVFWYLVLGTIPAVVVALLFKEQIESTFRSPPLIAIALAFVGFLLYWIDGKSPSFKEFKDITLKEALWVGLAQACAVIPGVSRSGATMTMARLLGVRREAAARFSFLLAFPVMVGACVFHWKPFLVQMDHVGTIWPFVIGLLSSTLFGFLSIHFLLLYLRTANFKVFAWYRILLAIFILVWSLA